MTHKNKDYTENTIRFPYKLFETWKVKKPTCLLHKPTGIRFFFHLTDNSFSAIGPKLWNALNRRFKK